MKLSLRIIRKRSGVCLAKEIQPDWGAQRVKGLSIVTALGHALQQLFSKDDTIQQKNTETSLIEQFMYPKLRARFNYGKRWPH